MKFEKLMESKAGTVIAILSILVLAGMYVAYLLK